MEGMYYGLGCLLFIIIFGVITGNMELEKARRKNMSNKVSFIVQVGYGTKVAPGCEIVVPSKPKSKRMSTSEVLSIASGTASLATMIATLANLLK